MVRSVHARVLKEKSRRAKGPVIAHRTNQKGPVLLTGQTKKDRCCSPDKPKRAGAAHRTNQKGPVLLTGPFSWEER